MNSMNDVQRATINSILDSIKAGNHSDAQARLSAVARDARFATLMPVIRRIRNLYVRHTGMILSLSISVIPPLFVLASVLFWFFVLPIQTWIGHTGLGEEFVSEIAKFISMFLAVVPFVFLEEIFKRYPTLIRPILPWVVLVPAVLGLSILLTTCHDAAYVLVWLIVKGKASYISNIYAVLLDYWQTSSILMIAFRASLSHFFLFASLVVSFFFTYKGSMSKRTAAFLEELNESSEYA